MSLQFFGYYNGTAATADHCNVGYVDVWDCSDERLERALSELRALRAAGMLAILNLHRLCCRTQWDEHGERIDILPELTWTMRLDVGALDKLDDALTREGLWWPTVAVATVIDEPFSRFVTYGQNAHRSAANLRLIHGYLKRRWPTLLLWLNFSAVELIRDRPEFLPQPSADAYGADVVGFDIYTDALPLGDPRTGSFQALIENLKQLCPGKPIVLAPDGLMFPSDTLPAKLQRIDDIYAIAQGDPQVVALLPYRWEEMTPDLLAHYRVIGKAITRKGT
jgi:hypothetical protein